MYPEWGNGGVDGNYSNGDSRRGCGGGCYKYGEDDHYASEHQLCLAIFFLASKHSEREFFNSKFMWSLLLCSYLE